MNVLGLKCGENMELNGADRLCIGPGSSYMFAFSVFSDLFRGFPRQFGKLQVVWRYKIHSRPASGKVTEFICSNCCTMVC